MRGRIWVGALVALCWFGAVAAADRVLDKPVFTATPQELLALAKAAPAGDWSVVVLRDEIDTSYDDKGRATMRWRSVFVIRTEAGAEDWNGIRTDWRPSYQDRPVVRARVIDAGGAVTELDLARITDEPAVHGPDADSDRRHLLAPLPALAVGSVVEQQIITSDREPLAIGSVAVLVIGNSVAGDSIPTSSTVLSCSAPAASKLHPVARRLPAGSRSRHEVVRGRERWVYEIAALPAQAYESSVPGDVVQVPYVGITSGVSWAAVARGYGALIDRQIAAGPVSWPAELPRTATLETVQAVTRWLHRSVRDGGSGLLDSAYLPAAPAETVNRGAGDGIDRATLLAALLRQAGLRADLALIETGAGTDVDPELPGLGQLDRTLVRARVGTQDVWIDPADDLVRPGQLPAFDQARRVLVIADDTRGLSITPVAAATDNVIHQERTYTAAEAGRARVTEVTRPTGAFETRLRRWFRATAADDVNETYSELVASSYHGTLDHVTAGDPADLATPLAIALTANEVGRVFSERGDIDVYLYPRLVLDELPDEVLDKPAAPRREDFAIAIPHVYEVENRIVVPTGYRLVASPPERRRVIGTARFTETRRIDGQTLIVTFRFESGKPRLSPAELAELQAGIGELGAEEVHIQIEHAAFALSASGQPREAIDECERLISLHPKEALHHDELATILMHAGAGAAARREARKAVALAPSAADPLVVLGWTLRFDTLGREWGYDWDRAGAIAALRKARTLEPSHAGAASELAMALQRDTFGRLLDGDADVRGAEEAWRAAYAIDKSEDNALGLVQVLLHLGQFAEAEDIARAAKQSDERDRWLIVAVAGHSGPKAAVAAATDLQVNMGRSGPFSTAAWDLTVLRRSETAREMLTAAGLLGRMPPEVSKVISQPAIKSGTADPRSAVFDALVAQADPYRDTPVFWDAALAREFRHATSFTSRLQRTAAATRWLGDIAQSSATVQIEGDAGLWRARVELGDRRGVLYLVLDHGVIKLIGASEMTSGVGRFLLSAGAGDPRAARLLDWIRVDLDAANDPTTSRFKLMWGTGLPRSQDATLLAAAVLARNSDPDRTLAVGTRCPTTRPDAQLICHDILVDSYVARKRWPEAAAELAAIAALRPDRAAAMVSDRAGVLLRAGRFDEAEQVVDDVLAKDPSLRSAVFSRFWVAAWRGSQAEALQRADVLLRHPRAIANDFNGVAWYRLVINDDLPGALMLAREASSRIAAPGLLNTVAAIEAELGELADAINDNWRVMALRGPGPPDDADWYVAGRIYEQLGLGVDAQAAYHRIAPSNEPFDVYTLAQRRLVMLRH